VPIARFNDTGDIGAYRKELSREFVIRAWPVVKPHPCRRYEDRAQVGTTEGRHRRIRCGQLNALNFLSLGGDAGDSAATIKRRPIVAIDVDSGAVWSFDGRICLEKGRPTAFSPDFPDGRGSY